MKVFVLILPPCFGHTFWLVISEPGWTSREKKVPLGIRHKPTRPSHGRFFWSLYPPEAWQKNLLPGLSQNNRQPAATKGGGGGQRTTHRTKAGGATPSVCPSVYWACLGPRAKSSPRPLRAHTLAPPGGRSLVPLVWLDRHQPLFARIAATPHTPLAGSARRASGLVSDPPMTVRGPEEEEAERGDEVG